MSTDSNRLLLALEKVLRDTNKTIINPEFEKLAISDLKPVIELVARARVAYLKEVFTIATDFPDALPPPDRIEAIKQNRMRYEELVCASQALETAIERHYLDVIGE